MYDTVGIGGKCTKVWVKVDLINFLVDLQDCVNLDIPRIALKSLHKRNGQLFRSHMRFRGSVWRDRVVVDWGAGYAKIPNKIWGFVDLSKLRKNSRIKFGGITQLQPAIDIKECHKPFKVCLDVAPSMFSKVLVLTIWFALPMSDHSDRRISLTLADIS